ncbi:MAG: D-TA family PLP-dependent enzyme [Paracoccaceae bacterium]|nr:D-TA family PLP-dependent enzyme [Paracoccaceae bacterium]
MDYSEIDTPAVLIDLNIVQLNIKKFQSYCDSVGLKLRPHIKTHKIPMLAKLQLLEGAIGITCQKISEAEAMISEGGIDDVLIAYNILGEQKLDKLLALAKRVSLSVVADNMICIVGLSNAFEKSGMELSVLVECDTGANRCGVISPEEALDLANAIIKLPGIRFGGLMTYPPIGKSSKVDSFLRKTKLLIERHDIKVPVISVGGSPDMWNAEKLSVATEYRIGTYIYNDRSLISRGVCKEKDCALTVLVTVVSTPTKERAVVDAGSKVLTSDLSDLVGHGHIVGYPNLKISSLSEEHGCITCDGPTGLSIGQKLQIIPNHACVVSNMLDHVIFVSHEKFEFEQRVAARGQVW